MILNGLSDAFSQLDEDYIIRIAQISRKAATKARRKGDELAWNFIGSLADYAHILYSLSAEMYHTEDSDGEEDSSAYPDPADLHSVLTHYYNDLISRIIADDFDISIEEAKVFLSLSGKYEIDIDFYF